MSVFTVNCCPEWKVNSVIELVLAEKSGKSDKLCYKLARNIAGQLHQYRRLDSSGDTALNLMVVNNTSITSAGACAHAITRCAVTSNAKFVEVYDCKGVYIETLKGFTADLTARAEGFENVPLFTVEMDFRSPLMISPAKHFIIKLKPISLKIQTPIGLQPSSDKFWLEDLVVKILPLDSNAGPDSLGAAAASSSALSETMRAEDIFDLSAAMSSMVGLLPGGAGGGALGMHRDLLKSLLPSVLPGAPPTTTPPPQQHAVTPPSVPVDVPPMDGRVIMDRAELVQLVEVVVDARTVALTQRVQRLEGQLAALMLQLQVQAHASQARVGPPTGAQAQAWARAPTLPGGAAAERRGPSASNEPPEPEKEILNYEFVENEF